jgi:SAM-dependent methyltransferase
MDFACGIGRQPPHLMILTALTYFHEGLNSREILPYARSVVGVDISDRMVERYNGRAGNQGLSSDEMRAVCTELKGVDGELDGMKFDVILVIDFPSV